MLEIFLPHLHCTKFWPSLIIRIQSNCLTRREILVIPKVWVCVGRGFFTQLGRYWLPDSSNWMSNLASHISNHISFPWGLPNTCYLWQNTPKHTHKNSMQWLQYTILFLMLKTDKPSSDQYFHPFMKNKQSTHIFEGQVPTSVTIMNNNQDIV